VVEREPLRVIQHFGQRDHEADAASVPATAVGRSGTSAR
jgi:hypothetical protein